MRWLFAPPLRAFVLLAAAASLLLNLALLAPALYMLQVFDRVFASHSLPTLWLLTLLAALALAFGYTMDRVRSRALAWAGRLLDETLSPAALAHGLQQAARGEAGDGERLRDIRVLRSFLSGSGVLALFDAPWLPVFLALITWMHPLLGLAALVAALLLLVVAVLTERLTRESSARAVQAARVAERRAETLARHAEVVVGMGMAGNALGAWRGLHLQRLDAQGEFSATASRLAALARCLRQAVQTLVLGVGAWLVIGAAASPGIMVAATVLLGRALQPVEQLIGGWKQLLGARSAWQRLNAPGSWATDHPALRLPPPQGRLQLEQVVYGADSTRPASIKAVSFTLDAGESLGIVGPSAAGKTTLLRLMLGLRVPRSGAVRLDGADIAQWPRDTLGAHLGYLPQDVALLAGTVAQNIARLGAVDAAQVVLAAQQAQVHEMILRLPQGYDTQVGEGGGLLSGGQRQRIALARALYGAPPLVLLDEPDAHLDAAGDAALKTALQGLKARGTTVVVVGHRPGLMAQMDKLAVLNDGRLDAFGPAAAVLARLAGVQAQPLPAAPALAQEIAA